jgi:hypothetical protein
MRRSASIILPFISLVAVSLVGCESPRPCTSRCIPRGLWQSPTYQATRAFLIVGDKTLHIEYLDGRSGTADCLGREGVREFYLYPGTHTLTATFNYTVPLREGLLGEVEGQPLTVEHEFLAGHAYVAFYREHPYPKPATNVAEVASNVREPDDRYYWTLEIVDLDEAKSSIAPEVRRARAYVAWIKGAAELSD